MIAAACESAEKVIADTRKAYGLDTRQRLSSVPTLDKAFSAKIQEKETLLRAAVNHGEGESLKFFQGKCVCAYIPFGKALRHLFMYCYLSHTNTCVCASVRIYPFAIF